MKLKLYIILFIFFVFAIMGANLYFMPQTNASLKTVLLCAFINPFVIIFFDALIAMASRLIPRSKMDARRKCFSPSKKELNFYRKIKINKWKDFVPETGKATTGFSKSKINGTQTDYLWLFLEETCYAEWCHYGMCMMGIIPCLIAHFIGLDNLMITLFIPQAAVNFLLNLPPSLIQRNNRPKLLHMWERQCKKNNI